MKSNSRAQQTLLHFCKSGTAWLSVAVFLTTFALFSPSLRYDFVHLDDITYISNNTSLHDGLSLAGIRHAFSFSNTSASMYMPLLWVSYMLDIEWLGASPVHPWGFHFTNVFLHSLNAALLLLLLQAIFKNPLLAFFCAAIWAWHPLRVESVAWVSERKDVLSGFFALLCITMYIQSKRNSSGVAKSLRYTIISVVSFTLGLLTKPALVTLSGVLLLLDVWPLQRLDLARLGNRHVCFRLLIEKIPFLLLSALASIGTVATHHVVSGEIPVSLTSRLLSMPLAYGFYLLKTFLPHNLTVLYPHWGTWLSPHQAIGLGATAMLILLIVLAATWRMRMRTPGALVGWLWFLFMLIPVSGIIPIPTNDVADRFTYLPAIGLSIALGALWIGPLAGIKAVARQSIKVFAVLLLLAIAIFSARQLPVWENADTLNARVLQVFPDHATALEIKAGNLMRSTGNFAEARRYLTRALQNDPHHWLSLLAKAQCIWALEGAEAARDFLHDSPLPTSRNTQSQWHRDLSRYALMLGYYEEALDHARRAMALLPPGDLSRIPLLFLAVTAAYKQGDISLALNYARQFPPYAEKETLILPDLLPHYIFQWIAGYRQDTVQFFLRLVEEYPERLDYLNNLVWALATADWSPVPPDDVLSLAEQLVAKASLSHPGVLDTLAAAQAHAGEFEVAIQTIEKAISLLPSPEQDPAVLAFYTRLYDRRTLYEQQQPHRESAFTRLLTAMLQTSTAPAPQ